MNTKSLLMNCALVAVIGWCIPAWSAPQVGWWWNPNESGRGFFIESQNGIMYLAGYFYESDGRATWVVAGGPNADPNSYRGRLLAYRSGQTLFGSYQPPAAPIDAGEVSVVFTDDTHGTFTWPGGTIPIERHQFGGANLPLSPDSGWYWNEAESGRGYSVEVQGDTLFIVGFMYDDAGHPLWYYSAGKMASETEYEGPLLQFAGGQTLTGSYHPPNPPVEVGRLGMEFTAIDEATLTITDEVPATAAQAYPKAGNSKMWDVKREFTPVKPTYDPAESYAGQLKWLSVFEEKGVTGSTTTTIEVKGNLTWTTDLDLPGLPNPTFRSPYYVYGLLASDPPLTFTFTHTTSGPGAVCKAEFQGKVHPTIDQSVLKVNGYAGYVGVVKFDPYFGIAMLKCTVKGETLPPEELPFTVMVNDVHFKHKVKATGGLTGKLGPKRHPEHPTTTVTVTWTFAAL